MQRISDRLDHPVLTGTAIRLAFLDALHDVPDIADAFRADIVATYDRDPATTRFIEPLLYFKGFHAIQTHRLAHWLWTQASQGFRPLPAEPLLRGVPDRHPSGCQDRHAAFSFDHATGLVVGETAVIEDDVSCCMG